MEKRELKLRACISACLGNRINDTIYVAAQACMEQSHGEKGQVRTLLAGLPFASMLFLLLKESLQRKASRTLGVYYHLIVIRPQTSLYAIFQASAPFAMAAESVLSNVPPST